MQQSSPKGLSVHIGLNAVDPNHYAGWSGPLSACEADATDLADLARAAGYDVGPVLLTSRATREGVFGALESAFSRLVPGDILLVTYSGHGGQVPDTNGDETEDLSDETWCLFDGQLIDDELALQWNRLPAGVRVVVLSDSCHSGTVVRVGLGEAGEPVGIVTREVVPFDGPGVRYRVAPRDVLFRTWRQNRGFYANLTREIPATIADPDATVRLISGCQDNQLSLDGTFNGLFTGTLLRVWNDGRFGGTYGDFHHTIRRRMPVDQVPNHFVIGPEDPAFDAQKPFQI